MKNPLAEVMQSGFRSWASRDVVYKRLYKKLSERGLALIDSALTDILDYTPSNFYSWVVHYHMTYYDMREDDRRLAIELGIQYLMRYVNGELRRSAKVLAASDGSGNVDDGRRNANTEKRRSRTAAT